MERCCYKSINETISEMREYRIRSRRESDLPSSIASEEFDNDTQLLIELSEKYKKAFAKERRPDPSSVDVCKEVEEMEDGYDEEEEEEEEEEESSGYVSPSKGCRTSFIRWKSPIVDFDEEGFNLLPEEKKEILRNNTEKILLKIRFFVLIILFFACMIIRNVYSSFSFCFDV